MIGQTVSHYKILAKLGEGGMGVVYKAHDTRLDRVVALKFLPERVNQHETEKARFLQEARAAAALNHANICTVYSIEENNGALFMVMEYLEGGTLREKLPFARAEEALSVAIQISDALQEAHSKGIVHRDIKADNVMLTAKGQAKVMDFGLAKLKGSLKLTRTSSTVGTLGYMAPEQIQGGEVDHRSDIFSFGVLLFEMLTGKLPFRGEHEAAMVYSIVNEEPQEISALLPDISPIVANLIARCLEKDPGNRYQHFDDISADLRRSMKKTSKVMRSSGHVPAAGAPPPPSWPAPLASAAPASGGAPRSKALWIGGAGAVLVVLAALAFYFKPFGSPSAPQGAGSAHNSLAVMYFENVTDPEDKDRTAKMITSLLVTGLSESKSLTVMSTQRLYDILKQLGKEGEKSIDKGVASEIAKKAGVNIVVTGEILQSKPTIILTAEVSEVDGGKILAAEKLAGTPEETIFAIVDKLSENIKRNLLASQPADPGAASTVADVTTHSSEAYKEYLEGMDDLDKLYQREAVPHFERAIALDSTFAMAHFQLAALQPSQDLSLASFQRAMRFSDRATRKDRELIRASEPQFLRNDLRESIRRLRDYAANYPDDKEGYYYLGILCQSAADYTGAIAAFSKTVELDPYNKVAYNTLAYAYDMSGDFDRSIWAIDKYISLAPSEANPFDSRGDLYAKHGKLAEAIDSYRKALAIKPDFYESLAKLGQAMIFTKQYAQAESCFQALSAAKDHAMRALAARNMVVLDAYQGKFKSALSRLDRLDENASGEWLSVDLAFFDGLRANIHCAMHNYPAAAKEADKSVRAMQQAKSNGPVYLRMWLIALLVQNHELPKAETVLAELKHDIDGLDSVYLQAYWAGLGCIQQAKGDLGAAIGSLEKGVAGNTFTPRHMHLVLAYLEAKRYADAIRELEAMESNYFEEGRLVQYGPIFYYYLGTAYELSGSSDKAVQQYETFLDCLKNADTAIPEIGDARQRLSRLKKKA